MKYPKRLRLSCLILLLGIAFTLFASENTGKDFNKFKNLFKKDYFSLGLVVQVVSDFQIERSFPGKSGLSLANVRFMVYGEFDERFGYLM